MSRGHGIVSLLLQWDRSRRVRGEGKTSPAGPTGHRPAGRWVRADLRATSLRGHHTRRRGIRRLVGLFPPDEGEGHPGVQIPGAVERGVAPWTPHLVDRLG